MSEGLFNQFAIGMTGEASLTVSEVHTAAHVGSGGVDALATPEMVRLMEQAAVAAGDHLLPPGYRTVGTHLDVSHLAPTPVGMMVTAMAELLAVEGKKLTFRVEAHDEDERVGAGTHQRVIIEVGWFRGKLESKVTGRKLS